MTLGLVAASGAHWYVGDSPSGPPGELALTTAPWPIRIPAGANDYIYLALGQRFMVHRHTAGEYAGYWKVRTLGYAYSLGDGENPDRAWIHWHFHPPQRFDPHIHTKSTDPGAALVEGIRGRHIPSGRVSIEAIIRYLIIDCDVGARDGWEEQLNENEGLFLRYRTWS